MKRLILLALLVGGCRLNDRFVGGAAAPDLGGADMTSLLDAGADLSSTSSPPDLTPPGPDLAPPACAAITVTTLTGTGVAGFMDGAGSVAEFNQAEGITVDTTTGNLYVADLINAKIRKVLADGTTSTFSSGGNLANPLRLAYVSQNIFVADQSADGLIEVVMTGTNSRDVTLSGIQSVAALPSNALYIANGAQIFTVPSSTLVFTGQTTSGFMDGSKSVALFGNIADFAFDASGKLYVADNGNKRIRVVAADGSVTTLAGSTVGHMDGPGATAQFAGPTGLAIDNQQHLVYVADGSTIRVVAADGTTSTLVGSTSAVVDGNGCTAKFAALHGIVLFAGTLYAVDLNRVRKIVLP